MDGREFTSRCEEMAVFDIMGASPAVSLTKYPVRGCGRGSSYRLTSKLRTVVEATMRRFVTIVSSLAAVFIATGSFISHSRCPTISTGLHEKLSATRTTRPQQICTLCSDLNTITAMPQRNVRIFCLRCAIRNPRKVIGGTTAPPMLPIVPAHSSSPISPCDPGNVAFSLKVLSRFRVKSNPVARLVSIPEYHATAYSSGSSLRLPPEHRQRPRCR